MATIVLFLIVVTRNVMFLIASQDCQRKYDLYFKLELERISFSKEYIVPTITLTT